MEILALTLPISEMVVLVTWVVSAEMVRVSNSLLTVKIWEECKAEWAERIRLKYSKCFWAEVCQDSAVVLAREENQLKKHLKLMEKIHSKDSVGLKILILTILETWVLMAKSKSKNPKDKNDE